MRRAVGLLLGALVASCLAGCGASAPDLSAADATFARQMLPHHVRAIEVGALAARRGGDPRVQAFGRRIVAEQTPERQRLDAWLPHPVPAPSMMPDGVVTNLELARLRVEPAPAFDRDVLRLSARSEAGAARMAEAELAAGRYGPARALARSIATAPHGEIVELTTLLAAL